MATDDTTAKDGGNDVVARGNSLYSTVTRSSTAHFVVHRSQCDEIVRQYRSGELSAADAWYAFEVSRDVLVSHLNVAFSRRIEPVAGPHPTAEAPAGIEPPSAGPG